METGQITELMAKQYDSLFEPKINENYVVYLDCKMEYGGAICGYDRDKNELFVIQEYLFGMPKVTLSGDYAVWLQQTGEATDRLYLYHLPTRESVEIEMFYNTELYISAPYISEDKLIYVQPQGESLTSLLRARRPPPMPKSASYP